MTEPTGSTVTGIAPARRLDRAAATDAARAHREWLPADLAVEPGDCVLDVGCGAGTGLAALAAAVGPTGRVFGTDRDPAAVARARAGLAGNPVVEVREGDASCLPLESRSVDRVRADRALLHAADPAAVLAQLRRVLRPGGLLALAEPDWSTLAVNHPELVTSCAFTRFVATCADRGQAVGRRLPRLVGEAGFTVTSARTAEAVFTDFDTAEEVLGLRRTTQRAVAAGFLDAQSAEAWLDHLTTRAFFGTVGFVTVLAQSAP